MNSPLKVFVASAAGAVLLIAYMYIRASGGSDEGEGSVFFYCAAGMRPPIDRIVADYEKEYGVKVQVQYEGSGTLLANLQVARHGDLYLAADSGYIDSARELDLIAETFTVARLRPVIAVQKGNPKNIKSLDDLLRDDVQFVLANHAQASVGKVTKKVLTKQGKWEIFQKKAKVFKPTVIDVATAVKVGAAVQAGVIWDATCAQYPDLEAVHVPELDAAMKSITIGVLKYSKNPTGALRFARYITARDRGLKHFEEKRYEIVDGDAWVERPKLVLWSGGVNRLAIDGTVKKFAKREGVEVITKYNGCGILVAEMETVKGSRNFPDGYFACDKSFMDMVEDDFDASVTLSETDMVLLAHKDNPHGIETLGHLARSELRVGIANPEQSALGALTVKLLGHLGVQNAVLANVKARGVQTPTADLLVNQVVLGSLDAAVVYEANTAKVRDKVKIIRIDHEHAKALQPIAVGKTSPHKHLMARLIETLRSARSRQKFESTGFRWLDVNGVQN